ncbi:tetratricopeptide repeat protein [Curtobacterium sp. 458]|uniref:tetratricopeptide repeat protein n=1 Tax=Curtobacterium sp. 458 TaxID=3050069 RepID=UPI0025B36796|nr:tetratricopeptide repeat protein [Curtobacterium sp. 458]WJX98884.1 tetratricopeptide repeat protein [Curtobacterium sp. 458]
MTDPVADPPPWRHPQVERALVAASELLEHGWPEDAVEPLNGALALHGDDPEVLRILAVAFWSAGDLDAARTAVRRAITTDPDDVEGYLLAAHLAEEADDVVEARSAWAAAVELVPSDGGLAAAQLVLDLRTGQVDAATYAAATRAATAHPQHAQVNLALAWLAAREGYPGTAERALVAAVAATPADPWPRWQLLRARERRGSTIAVLADAALVLAEHPDAAGPLGAFRRAVVRLASLGTAFIVVGLVLAGTVGVLVGMVVDDPLPPELCCAALIVGVVLAQVAVLRRLGRALPTGWRPFVGLVRRRVPGVVVVPVLQAATLVAAGVLLVLAGTGAPGLADGVAAAAAGGALVAAMGTAGFLGRWYA